MQKGEETRELILRKSAELFNVFGYDGCSMNDIMKATGLQKGGIYNHFPTKDDLALAAFEFSLKAVIERFRLRLDSDKTSWAKINSVIDVIADFHENPVIIGGCPIFNTAIDSMNSDTRLKEKARAGLRMLVDYVEIKIKEGIASGEFRQVSNPTELAAMIVTTMEGGVIMSRAFEDGSHVATCSKYVRMILEEKLLG